jgi:hypothetical protein
MRLSVSPSELIIFFSRSKQTFNFNISFQKRQPEKFKTNSEGTESTDFIFQPSINYPSHDPVTLKRRDSDLLKQ